MQVGCSGQDCRYLRMIPETDMAMQFRLSGRVRRFCHRHADLRVPATFLLLFPLQSFKGQS